MSEIHNELEKLQRENAELRQRSLDEGKEWLQKCAEYEREMELLTAENDKLERENAELRQENREKAEKNLAQYARIAELEKMVDWK